MTPSTDRQNDLQSLSRSTRHVVLGALLTVALLVPAAASVTTAGMFSWQQTDRALDASVLLLSADTATDPDAGKTAAKKTHTPATNKKLGKKMMLQWGWLAKQWPPLHNLWMKESGWRHLVGNSSGAYGIPQAYPGSKMASAGKDWKTNPATQIKWGLNYIRGRYGSPAAAWAHFQNNGWY